MVASEDNQDDRLIVHPDDSSIVCNEWLAIARFMCNSHVLQVAGKAVVDLLLLHDAQD